MMQADLNWRLIVPGATQEEEEERYRNQRGCRCCCDGAHREKASFYSLVLVLLLVLLLVGTTTIGKYLQWESNEGHAFCHGGFNYSSGLWWFPKKGIYRVFLQITYEGDDCSEPEINLYSRVFVHSERYPLHTALLSASDIVKCGPWTWRKSLYSAGLHKLEAKSRLHVNATHRSFCQRTKMRCSSAPSWCSNFHLHRSSSHIALKKT
ncbi:LOW QUALITY PROTEIN: lymphotoxin-alpha [Gouania willdenowi]|uniref:LOW QUALITY PROTEIN: lymphotoxin-alpha n=1 Tax=Gouania willdenowi TaxID=441366 RepID=UPI0010555929|nr:LOW QUALITY PROTEIN: lymphotoxin-alpha-like [Gouania willdenowi]